MEVDKLDDIELYQEAFEIQQIGNEAIEEVIKKRIKTKESLSFSQKTELSITSFPTEK